MESREYRRGSSRATTGGSDPLWLVVGAILAVMLALIALPALIIGFVSQRYIRQFGWSFGFWFLLCVPAAVFFYLSYQHGLQPMMVHELADYVQNGKHAQTDLAAWHIGQLWSETWPVWIQTLVAIPLVGVWLEVSTQARGGQTASNLVQSERRRERRVAQAQQRARKRTLRPERLPDQVGGLMVIGVPIDDEEQE